MKQFALVALIALTGCAAPSQSVMDTAAQAKATAPRCSSDARCAAMMAAAKAWMAKAKMPPLEVETPTQLKTFDRGAYWGITVIGTVDLKPVDATERELQARFGWYTPGNAPFYDPKLYSMTVQFNKDVSAAAQ